MNFLILSTAPQKHLAEAIEEAGHTFELAAPGEFQMFLNDKPAGYDAVFRNEKAVTRKMFDCVLSRLGSDRAFGARLLRHFRQNLGVFTLQTGAAVDICSDKWHTSQLLSAAKIRVPIQFFCSEIPNLDFIIEKLGGLPVIAKPTSGSQGKGVMKIVDAESANGIIEYLHQTKQNFILQQYIDTSTAKTGGSDLRLIVCGDKVVSAMRRTAPQGKLRANLSIDATGEKIDPTPEQKEMAIKAIAAIDGLAFGGVDIMTKEHPEGDINYLIEVNSNPGTKIVQVTDYNHFTDVVAYCEQQAPIYKRAFDAASEKRSTLPDGVSMEQLADVIHRLHYIATGHHSDKQKDELVKAYRATLPDNTGDSVMKLALETVQQNFSENRGWTF
jgi:ribosomal protein S6--L-glutamate ligase